MKLVLDLGNTLQKVGIFQGDILIRAERYDRIRVPLLKHLLAEYPDIRAGIASSVVRYPAGMKQFLTRRLQRFIELDYITPLPLINMYRTPRTLGRDRIACAVAASRLYPGLPVLVVNAGTCITVDFVTAAGEYLGGSISPGLRMRLQAMHTFTGKLPLLELREPDSLIGSNTTESMLSGAVNGAVNEMAGMILVYRRNFPDLQVILSGGDMEYLEKLREIRIFALPNIVLTGLNYILEYNLKHAQ